MKSIIFILILNSFALAQKTSSNRKISTLKRISNREFIDQQQQQQNEGELDDFSIIPVSDETPLATSIPVGQLSINLPPRLQTPGNKKEGLCPSGATGQFPYPEECNKFVNCWKGRGMVQVCAPGTLFNSETLQCDWPAKVKCLTDSLAAQNLTAYSQIEQQKHKNVFLLDERISNRFVRKKRAQSVCASANGLFPHPTICSKFIQCWHGQTYVKDCRPGTYFNPKASVCDWPFNVDCRAVAVPNRSTRKCGRVFVSAPNSRIVGGRKVLFPGTYPWQASMRVILQTNGPTKHSCGAVIISSNYLLTAAHCFKYHKSHYKVRVGDHNTNAMDEQEQQFSIKEYYIHELYSGSPNWLNDIALIKVEGRIKMGTHVQPICLPLTQPEQNTQCVISGWGQTTFAAGISQHLLAASVPLLSVQTCSQAHGSNLKDGMLCAGYLEGGVDTCGGDSGGPLACLIDNAFTLAGLTSWGAGCGLPNKPGVYTNVYNYLSWISSKIRN